MDESRRCLQCDLVCNVCTTVCPNRANVALLSLPMPHPVQVAVRDGDGVRVERTSDGDEFDLGISREGVAAATRDVNAIYKDGVQVAAELKSTFDEISDSLSFLKKKK